ncbi:hypothetical protein KY325_01545 [Candidatus Woesearchaeota archaeon]|nr:hypothetical protein [Candidatus Woesearchaeota archaeon]MBW3017822.1 hypothetical protein [Candidatus Woesearchaeota archaeon]
MAFTTIEGDGLYSAVGTVLQREAEQGRAKRTFYSGEQWKCPDKEQYTVDEAWTYDGLNIKIHRNEFEKVRIEVDGPAGAQDEATATATLMFLLKKAQEELKAEAAKAGQEKPDN